jgi:glutathione S-transferase
MPRLASPLPSLSSNVPALVLDDGTLLNEGSAVLQWFADQNAASGLAPAYGTIGRYKVMNMLNWTASEFHVAVGGLFNPTLDEAGKAAQMARAHTKLAFAEKNLVPEGTFLFGDALTVADLYFWIVVSWCPYLGVDLAAYPKVSALFAKVNTDPRIAEGKAKMA